MRIIARSHLRPYLALAALAALAGPLLVPAAAGAQDIAAAEALFDRGLADMEAGRYETGCKAIAESQRLDPRPGTLFTLATCEARWGRVATAVTRYGDYLATFDRLPEDRRAAQGERPAVAKAEREKLAPLVPQLTVSLPKGAPPGTVAKRDGEVLSDAALGVALPVDPGDHVVSVQAPGGAVREKRITLAKGDKKVVTLEIEAAPAVSSAPRERQPPPSRSYAGPIAGIAAGVVGLGVGIGAGIAVLGKRSELDGACPEKACPSAQQGNLEDAKTLSYVSTGGFVLAGVGAAVGTVLLLLPAPHAGEKTKIHARVGAGYLGVEGAF